MAKVVKEMTMYDLAQQDYQVLEEMISKDPSLITKKDTVSSLGGCLLTVVILYTYIHDSLDFLTLPFHPHRTIATCCTGPPWVGVICWWRNF